MPNKEYTNDVSTSSTKANTAKPNITGAIDAPNYTQTPNAFFDKIMPQINSMSELKITLVIIRQTFGWFSKTGGRKTEDQLSVTRLMTLTGLSRQSILDGIESGMKRGTILRRKKGAQDYMYRLNLAIEPVNNLDRSKSLTGLESRPVPVQILDRSPVYILDPQKKDERKERKEEGANALLPVVAIETLPETNTALILAVSDSKHPAVQAYRELHFKFPRKSLDTKRKDDDGETLPEMARIVERVGDAPEAIKLWKTVMTDWNDDAIAHNISVKHDKTATKWNPSGVKTLLEKFTNRRSEVAFEQKQRAVMALHNDAPADRRGVKTIKLDNGQYMTLAQPR